MPRQNTALASRIAPGTLSAPGAILLVSTYELGHQPLTLAAPLAALREAGFAPRVRDTSVEEVSDDELRAARLIAISTPMHTALRLAAPIAARIRTLNPSAFILFYGLYAALNAETLLSELADAIAGGEYQRPLLELARALDINAALDTLDIPGLRLAGTDLADESAAKGLVFPSLRRESGSGSTVPARDTLPELDRYARLARGADLTVAGYVETTRGCLHTCTHCPITPVYRGRFYVNPRAAVLEDIRQQVRAGAGHITFGDPDFFNGPGHGMAIIRALHAEFSHVTFDVTIKVEHILERRALIPELADLSCAFVVSAVESLSPVVLERLAKGHTRADVVEALSILDDADIPMRPTFVAFTPWTSASDYLEVLDFVAEHDLIEQVDPIQYAIRLLVPPGSALLSMPDAAQWFGALDPATLSHVWKHPDPRMDTLQRAVMALVERDAALQAPTEKTFAAIRKLAAQRLDPAHAFAAISPRAKAGPVPRLTEAWFCCAEPTSEQWAPITPKL
jgi:radical SAM superfamily enzyme YgiQ (UPF0313 family)